MGDHRKLVSVVTPTRSRTEELARCVASVSRQSYRPIEHIVVGDNHPLLDNRTFQARLRELQPGIVFLNLHQIPDHEFAFFRPFRTSYLRNVAILQSHGAYIAHLDDDNEILEDHVRSLVHLLERHADADVAYSWRELVNRDGSPYLEERYPWMEDGAYARAIYDILVKRGIFTRGSNVVRDAVIAQGELVFSVDTSELMLRREAQLRHLFATGVCCRQVMQHHSEDYLLMRHLHESGVRMLPTQQPSLRYYLGGYSNAGDDQ